MPSTPAPDVTLSAPFAGFWRRVAAFLVDGLIIGLVGYLLGRALFDVFVRLGPWGPCVGFVVALGYFVLQEGARSGQSLGKRLLGIRVVDAQGRVLRPTRGAARFVVLVAPYFLLGAALPMGVTTFAGGIPLALVALGGLIALAYLLAFNRRTRQSLHDLAVGAFVVRATAGARRAPRRARAWGGHLAIAGVLALLAGTMPLLHPRLARAPELGQRLAAQPELRSVDVFEAEPRIYSIEFSGVRRELLIQATIVRPLDDYVPLSTRLAGIALATFPAAAHEDLVSVRLAYGFDIGIASNWTANELALKPEQWADRVAAGVGN